MPTYQRQSAFNFIVARGRFGSSPPWGGGKTTCAPSRRMSTVRVHKSAPSCECAAALARHHCDSPSSVTIATYVRHRRQAKAAAADEREARTTHRSQEKVRFSDALRAQYPSDTTSSSKASMDNATCLSDDAEPILDLFKGALKSAASHVAPAIRSFSCDSEIGYRSATHILNA